MWLKIQNDGELDTAALFLMGASTKNENQIGYFGTGIKYAMCYFLRNDIDFRIFSGKKEIHITLEKQKLREEEFFVVHIDGKQTSLTTRLGRDWSHWYSVREVYCNCLDEPNPVISVVESIEDLEDNTTAFYLHMTDELQGIVDNIEEYFSFNRKPIYECDEGRIYERAAKHTTTYRKGVKCNVGTSYEGVFDYDLNNIQINEQREAQYYWHVIEGVWNMLYKCTDASIIKKIITAGCRDYENTVGNGIASTRKDFINKEAWEQALEGITVFHKGMVPLMSESEIQQAYELPFTVIQDMRSTISINLPRSVSQVGDEAYMDAVLTNEEQQALDDAIDMLARHGLTIPYPIKVVHFNDNKIHGMADIEERQIYIADITLSKGLHWIMSTLIEEYVHVKHRVKDETRSMQDALIDELIHALMR